MQTQNNGTPAFRADCGHTIPALPAGHTGGTGYATTSDNRRICYECAAVATRAHMLAEGRECLYVVYRPRHDTTPAHAREGTGWFITDWPGVLEFPVFNVTISRGCGFGRSYRIVTGRFRGPAGELWTFRNQGDNQIARCRRLKDPR